MADFIIINGDKAIFLPTFGQALVVVQPGVIRGTGPATLNDQKLCVDGDETSVEVPGCMYTAGQFSIPGTGTLKIAQLASNQLAKKTNSGGKAVILKGGQFTAKFEVQNPAKQPPPGPGSPIPDATKEYSGQGMFQTTNTKFMGT
jgi:hypothetical protein